MLGRHAESCVHRVIGQLRLYHTLISLISVMVWTASARYNLIFYFSLLYSLCIQYSGPPMSNGSQDTSHLPGYVSSWSRCAWPWINPLSKWWLCSFRRLHKACLCRTRTTTLRYAWSCAFFIGGGGGVSVDDISPSLIMDSLKGIYHLLLCFYCMKPLGPPSRVDLGFFFLDKFSNFPPPPPRLRLKMSRISRQWSYPLYILLPTTLPKQSAFHLLSREQWTELNWTELNWTELLRRDHPRIFTNLSLLSVWLSSTLPSLL